MASNTYPCLVCDEQISPNADPCPHCGEPDAGAKSVSIDTRAIADEQAQEVADAEAAREEFLAAKEAAKKEARAAFFKKYEIQFGILGDFVFWFLILWLFAGGFMRFWLPWLVGFHLLALVLATFFGVSWTILRKMFRLFR